MPKTIWTPRDELVCGKLDRAYEIAVKVESLELIDLLADIRHDCERMEQKLISRKEEVARLKAPANIQQQAQPATQAPEEKPAPVGQTRRGSLLESLVNILVGYSVNFTANLLIFPLFGWHISARENLTLGVIYTGISLVRSYGLRRLFNHKDLKK